MRNQIVYILEKFPSPTEHFILNEMYELEKQGLSLCILVVHKQKRYIGMQEVKNIKSPVIYLPKTYYFLSIFVFFLFPFSVFRFPFPRKWPISDNYIKNFRDYCISLFFANKLKKYKISHIHSHFAFITVDIAYILASFFKIKFSLSVHAQDIYTNTERIKQIIYHCAFLITCTRNNVKYINEITKSKYEKKIFMVYHGIHASKWETIKSSQKMINDEINILSIARLIEKKGLKYLIKSVKIIVDKGFKVKCTIIGEGQLQKPLERFIRNLEIQEFVEIIGFIPQSEVKRYLLKADVFVLPCVIANNNDMDGLPNVIVEAMICGLPVVSTSVSAIPEIIEERITGMIVKEKDELSIVGAILELKNNNVLLNNIILNAKKKIKSNFAIEDSTNELINIFSNNIPKQFK